MKLDEQDIKTCRMGVEMYDEMSNALTELINKHNGMSTLVMWLSCKSNVTITNTEYRPCVNVDFQYIDFIVGNILSMTIVKDDKNGIPLHVSKGFQIFNSAKDRYIVEDWLTTEDYLDIIRRGEL